MTILDFMAHVRRTLWTTIWQVRSASHLFCKSVCNLKATIPTARVYLVHKNRHLTSRKTSTSHRCAGGRHVSCSHAMHILRSSISTTNCLKNLNKYFSNASASLPRSSKQAPHIAQNLHLQVHMELLRG